MTCTFRAYGGLEPTLHFLKTLKKQEGGTEGAQKGPSVFSMHVAYPFTGEFFLEVSELRNPALERQVCLSTRNRTLFM